MGVIMKDNGNADNIGSLVFFYQVQVLTDTKQFLLLKCPYMIMSFIVQWFVEPYIVPL